MHGYVHVNHSCLSQKQQIENFSKAVRILMREQSYLKVLGCPYLRWSEDTIGTIGRLGFIWDSSKSVVWDVIEKEDFNYTNWQAYQRLLNLYQPKETSKYPVLPEFENNFAEIPVSIPDDEALVDRLRITKD